MRPFISRAFLPETTQASRKTFVTFLKGYPLMGKRKSSYQHRQEGTWRADRHEGDEIPVSPVVPFLPLTEGEQHWFNKLSDLLYQNGLCAEIDSAAVCMMAYAFHDLIHFREKSRGDDALTEGENGKGFSAEWNAQQNAWKKLSELMRRFGMTPTDRLGLPCGGEQAEDDFDRLLRRCQQ